MTKLERKMFLYTMDVAYESLMYVQHLVYILKDCKSTADLCTYANKLSEALGSESERLSHSNNPFIYTFM